MLGKDCVKIYVKETPLSLQGWCFGWEEERAACWVTGISHTSVFLFISLEYISDDAGWYEFVCWLYLFFPQYFQSNASLSFFAFQGPSLKQFMDIFSLPEMTLLSSVIDYFITHGIEFDQVHLYKDISVSEMSTASQLTPHQSCELCSTQTQGVCSDQPDMTTLLSL